MPSHAIPGHHTTSPHALPTPIQPPHSLLHPSIPQVHQKIDTEHLAEYLATKNLEDETHKLIDGNHVVKVR